MKHFTFESKELDELDFGVLGLLPWTATYSVDGESVRVWFASGLRHTDEDIIEIDCTEYVRGERELKELILKQHRKEQERDEDRPYDEWKDRQAAGE